MAGRVGSCFVCRVSGFSSVAGLDGRFSGGLSGVWLREAGSQAPLWDGMVGGVRVSAETMLLSVDKVSLDGCVLVLLSPVV